MFDHIEEISSEDLEEELKDKNYIIIDVRENEEVAQGMIPNAQHIPLQQVPGEFSNLDKSAEYVIVCRSGRRSMNACLYLSDQGFQVKNLLGGMLDWKGEIIF